MTKEEAIKVITSNDVFDADLIYEAVSMAIKALEQEPILDKIRAEIEELDTHYDNDYFVGNKDAMFKCDEVMQIIDKYRGEEDEIDN